MFKTFYKIISDNQKSKKSNISFRDVLIRTLYKIKSSSPLIDVVVGYEDRFENGKQVKLPIKESLPFFDYEYNGNIINLKCLYFKSENQNFIMENDKVFDFLGLKNVEIFNKNKKESTPDDNFLNNFIKNEKSIDYEFYKTFAFLKITKKYSLSGYYLDLFPSKFPFRQNYVDTVLNPFMIKISNILKNTFKDIDILGDYKNFLDPIQDSFFGSAYIEKFENMIKSKFLNKIVFSVQQTTLTQNEKDLFRDKINSDIISMIINNQDYMSNFRILLSELYKLYQNGRSNILGESPVDILQNILNITIDDNQTQNDVENLLNKIEQYSFYRLEKNNPTLDKLSILKNSDIINALSTLISNFKDLLLSNIQSIVDSAFKKLEDNNFSDNFVKQTSISKFFKILADYISKPEDNKKNKNKLFKDPNSENFNDYTQDIDVNNTESSNVKNEDNKNKTDDQDNNKYEPESFYDASEATKQSFMKDKGITINNDGSYIQNGVVIEDMDDLYNDWKKNQSGDAYSDDTDKDLDDTDEDPNMDAELYLQRVFNTKVVNIKYTAELLENLYKHLQNLIKKYSDRFDYGGTLSLQKNVQESILNVLPLIRIPQIQKFLKLIVPKYSENVKLQTILVLVGSIANILKAIVEESIDFNDEVKPFGPKLKSLVRHLFDVMNRAAIGGNFYSPQDLTDIYKRDLEYDSKNINTKESYIVDDFVLKYDVRLELNFDKFKNLDLSTIGGFSNEILNFDKISEVMKDYNIIVDGEKYKYSEADKDFISTNKNKLIKKFLAIHPDKQYEQLLTNNYELILKNTLKYLYGDMILPTLGIKGDSLRTFNGISKLIDKLLANNGVAMFEIRDNAIRESLSNIVRNVNGNTQLEFLVNKIESIYNEFKELTK